MRRLACFLKISRPSRISLRANPSPIRLLDPRTHPVLLKIRKRRGEWRIKPGGHSPHLLQIGHERDRCRITSSDREAQKIDGFDVLIAKRLFLARGHEISKKHAAVEGLRV